MDIHEIAGWTATDTARGASPVVIAQQVETPAESPAQPLAAPSAQQPSGALPDHLPGTPGVVPVAVSFAADGTARVDVAAESLLIEQEPVVSAILADQGQPAIALAELALPLCLVDRAGAILWANAPFWLLAPGAEGIARAGTMLAALIDPVDRHRLTLPVTQPVELRFADAGGPGRRHELRLAGRPAIAADGGRATSLLAAIDVEDRRAESDFDAVLRQELGHRLRNIVTLMAALTTDTLGRHPDAAGVARLLDRLRSLQTAGYVGNEVLAADCSVARIGRRILDRFHDPADRRVLIEGDDVAVTRRWGNTLALILHELATNCVKHGALSVRAGMVTLRWCRIAEPDRTMLHVEWREIGGPLVREPAARGQGLDFIDRVLSTSKGAHAAFRFAPTGFVCQLDLPIEHHRRSRHIVAEPRLHAQPHQA
ncbi:sensor histidine kinase [Sphingomonas donggukensis]|uniref:histidine kinase n=1 Tax=Sphingomonas donggukensis TaxID=2949093 RepID=A0ABY4TYF1_9SPHN|nr:sensor histidine kinase [Sphingomonas donggukensis]URW75576.1 sensor histidine kinase [Sphingomonas donggukensis]